MHPQTIELFVWESCVVQDEDDNLNNGTVTQDPGKALVATLGSIEVPEDSPVLTKPDSNIPIIQMAGNSDADLSADDEMSLNFNNRYFSSICTYVFKQKVWCV